MDHPPADTSYAPPIHRLPTELLHSILLLAYYNDETNIWNLACIDSRLRSIVISTPLFWTAIRVVYIHHSRQDFGSLIERLRTQLRRSGPVLPLTVVWITSATEYHASVLLSVFNKEKAPFNRWKVLSLQADRLFPHMPVLHALGEFTTLQSLSISGSHTYFFFSHIEKTRDLSKLESLHVMEDSRSYEQLKISLPRVLGAIKVLGVQAYSTFSSGLPPNLKALECNTLDNRFSFPHLEELTVKSCSIRPNPSDIPLVTRLRIHFHISYTENSVLVFPALTSLVLACAMSDLSPLTWLAAPNLTSIKLETVSELDDMSIHDSAPPIKRRIFLDYPCVSEVEIEIPLDLAELGALLPHFPATQRMVIPLDLSTALQGFEVVLFNLLGYASSSEQDGQYQIRYKDLEIIQLLSEGKAEFDEDRCKMLLKGLLNTFPDSKLCDLRIVHRG